MSVCYYFFNYFLPFIFEVFILFLNENLPKKNCKMRKDLMATLNSYVYYFWELVQLTTTIIKLLKLIPISYDSNMLNQYLNFTVALKYP